jgi:hypothetical protein
MPPKAPLPVVNMQLEMLGRGFDLTIGQLPPLLHD